MLFDAPMGAGKTTFISFVIKFLNPEAVVSSPTFAIINKYADNIFHADLYRVDSAGIENTGLFDIIADENNFVFVEWADKFENAQAGRLRALANPLFRIKINILEGSRREFIID